MTEDINTLTLIHVFRLTSRSDELAVPWCLLWIWKLRCHSIVLVSDRLGELLFESHLGQDNCIWLHVEECCETGFGV